MNRSLLQYSSALVLCLGWAATTPGFAQAPRRYTFAAGSPSGNYYRLAEELAEEASATCSRCRILVRSSAGSYENAQLLRDKQADIALMQGDVAYLENFQDRSFVVVASLFVEPLHIIARRELGLRRISELATRKRHFTVEIGPQGSGTSSQALMLLEELDLPPGHVSWDRQPFSAALKDLSARRADIVFHTSSYPIPELNPLVEGDVVTLLDIDGDIARSLTRKYPFFTLTEIPFDAYGVTPRNIRTLGTRTLLVVRRTVGAGLVTGLLDGLYRLASDAEDEGLPFLEGLTPDVGLREVSIPVYPTSLTYHRNRASRVTAALRLARAYAVPILVLVTPLLVLIRLSRFAYFVHQFMLGRVLVMLVTVWLLGSATMHMIEGHKNSSFRSFQESSIAILHYLFSGLEAKYPVTMAGNVVAIIILSLGVAVVTLFTATVVTLLIERVLDLRKLKPKPWVRLGLRLKNHVVIVGWSRRAERVLRQLRSKDLRTQPTVVVVAPTEQQVRTQERKAFRNTWLVQGNVSEAATLRRADVPTADSALILCTHSVGEAAGFQAVASTLAVERMEPRVRTIVEAPNTSLTEHLQCCMADESVNTELLGERMLSQCVITPGIASVYEELLTFARNSQEIHFVPLPRRLDGLRYRDLACRFADRPLIVLGYRLGGAKRIVLNPGSPGSQNGSSDRRLRSRRSGSGADSLVILADNDRALGHWWTRFATDGREGERSCAMESLLETKVRTEETPNPREVHIGICGWNDQARAVIDQLREEVISSRYTYQITVICNPRDTRFDSKGNDCLHENVRFVVGDPSRRLVLRNAGIAGFDSLVIMADLATVETAEFSDHRSLMIALAAADVAPDLHIVAEVLKSENREHFRRIPNVEIVSVEDLAEKLLAQAVISPGITQVYLELLTATEDSNEIYIVPVPPPWIGRSFQSLILELADSERQIIPLGYRRPSRTGRPPRIVLNPGHKKTESDGLVSWRHYELEEGDALVVLAYEEPAW